VTPAGNPGVIEGEATITPGGPFFETVLISGETGALKATGWRDNNRRFPTASKIRFFNGATQFEAIDVYLVTPGSAITSAFPLASVGSGDASSQSTIGPREYDLFIADFATTTVLFGPQTVTLEANGLYSLLVLNGENTE